MNKFKFKRLAFALLALTLAAPAFALEKIYKFPEPRPCVVEVEETYVQFCIGAKCSEQVIKERKVTVNRPQTIAQPLCSPSIDSYNN